MATGKSIKWSFDLESEQWDRILASCGGHPLQSALWGNARKLVDGGDDRRWAAFVGNDPIWMGRFEIRHLPFCGKVAWLPRGPVLIDHPLAKSAHQQFLELLKKEGFLLCFTDPYPQILADVELGRSFRAASQTLWLDLKKGKESLFDNMHKKLRYGVRAAERAGVLLEESRAPEDVTAFFQLCDQVSEAKQFTLPGSEPLLQKLLLLTQPGSSYKAHLFVARFEGRVVSGYLSIENGHSLHNIWNGTDRSQSKECPGEAVLWHQVAWGVNAGLSIYDQEGIDEKNNPGCYSFKMRLGGEIVTLPGMHAKSLSQSGKVLLRLGQWIGKV